MKTKLKTNSALSYFGSDGEVAGSLAGLLDHCKHVSIPFVGGASIIAHLNAKAIVANDLNDHAINFFRVLGGLWGEFAKSELIRRCEFTLSHPADMEYAEELMQSDYPTEKAWAYWAACWIGRKGAGGTDRVGGKPSVRRKADGGNNASRLMAAQHDLGVWATLFRRCEWECRDFRDFLASVADDPSNGIYCDPPWFGAGDAYVHKFTEQDHIDLRDSLERFTTTTVVVRYGDDPKVRELYSGWSIIESSSRTQSNARKGELWIVRNGR